MLGDRGYASSTEEGSLLRTISVFRADGIVTLAARQVDRAAPLAISERDLAFLDGAVRTDVLVWWAPSVQCDSRDGPFPEQAHEAVEGVAPHGYDTLLVDISQVIEEARHAVARSVNAVMTTTYWLVGRRIVEQEQQGVERAAYGEQLLKRLSRDLSKRFGRGFSERNLEQMRGFYLGWPISQAAPAESFPVPHDPRFRRQRLRNRSRSPAPSSHGSRCHGLTT